MNDSPTNPTAGWNKPVVRRLSASAQSENNPSLDDVEQSAGDGEYAPAS